MLKRNSKNKWLFLSRLAGLAAIVILLAGVMLAWNQYKKTGEIVVQAAPHIAGIAANTSSEPPPDTAKPDENAFTNHKVATNAPRYIFIPNISVRAMIKPVGITKDNRIDAPRNVFDAGWYTSSAKPGEPGAMVVDGHVSSWKTHGVFYDLKIIKPGDAIEIERGDGKRITYTVAKSQTYDADAVDMAAVLKSVNPGKPGLNLITCAGKVTPGTNNFNKRIVIFAEAAVQ